MLRTYLQKDNTLQEYYSAQTLHLPMLLTSSPGTRWSEEFMEDVDVLCNQSQSILSKWTPWFEAKLWRAATPQPKIFARAWHETAAFQNFASRRTFSDKARTFGWKKEGASFSWNLRITSNEPIKVLGLTVSKRSRASHRQKSKCPVIKK